MLFYRFLVEQGYIAADQIIVRKAAVRRESRSTYFLMTFDIVSILSTHSVVYRLFSVLYLILRVDMTNVFALSASVSDVCLLVSRAYSPSLYALLLVTAERLRCTA